MQTFLIFFSFFLIMLFAFYIVYLIAKHDRDVYDSEDLNNKK